MFVTRYDERSRWYQITAPGFGDERIENERQREVLVRRFERAEQNQMDPLP